VIFPGDAKSLSAEPTPTRRLFAFKVLRQQHCLESFSCRIWRERKGKDVLAHNVCQALEEKRFFVGAVAMQMLTKTVIYRRVQIRLRN